MEFASTDRPLLGLALCLPANRPAVRPPGRPLTCRRPPAAYGPPTGCPTGQLRSASYVRTFNMRSINYG